MERPVVYYVFDVLCSWCYGFSETMHQFHEDHKDSIDFRIMSGGMVLGEREGAIGDLPDAVKEGFKRVEEMSGRPFSAAFYEMLEKGEAQLSSLPGALALATLRTYQPDNAMAFAKRMQEAFYQEGLPPAQAATFGHCAEDFGMNSEDFMKLMVDKERLELVQKEFEVVKQWGITGFPTVVYQDKDKAYLLARGFVSREQLDENLKKIQELV
tara:strand:- start:132 stop:767 length:636 start_codon:yes stop_codon:yes gene_type:complete